MFQVIASWNLSWPDEVVGGSVRDTKLRGWEADTFLTGNFAVRLKDGEIPALSVGNIADVYCPTRRDLYFYKGIRRPRQVGREHWGQKVGHFVETYLEALMKEGRAKSARGYPRLMEQGQKMHDQFVTSKKQTITELKKFETGGEGDTDWLLTLLANNGRSELAAARLHSLLRQNDSLDLTNVQIKKQVTPNPLHIGIGAPAEPDFMAPKFGMVGDIKTGIDFRAAYQLTCTGYALAYENGPGSKDKVRIDWGVIYFFPTRNPTALVKPLTSAQVYIFPIDDYLRQLFINRRDEAYNIISKKEPPPLPKERKEKAHCPYCRFRKHCEKEGLEIDGVE